MSILDRIVTTKRTEVEQAQASRPAAELRAAIRDAPPIRDFFTQLAESTGIGLIAEVKKASPSKGLLRDPFDPVDIARAYADNGARCISVLTDAPFFQGQLDYLLAIRQVVEVPLLRKDFILDSYQLLEARVHGADAVLLIAECLDDCNLRKLHNECLELGMTPLVELYESQNVSRVLEAGATLVGVNNRDLRTFEVDLNHTLRIKEQLPDECLVVGESGIYGRDDVLKLEAAGIDAMLVGEYLVKQLDVAQAVRTLLGS